MSHFPDRIRRLPFCDASLAVRRLEAGGCQVLFASYRAMDRVPARQCQTENLGVVTEGELRLTLHGVERSYHVGQWYHIPAFAPHAAWFRTPTSVIEFRFPRAPAGEAAGDSHSDAGGIT